MHPTLIQQMSQQKCPSENESQTQIRVSAGTAMVLGLLDGKLDAAPTTAYLMTYKVGKCTANCGFCPQARQSKSSAELLSRVTWPIFPTQNLLKALARAVAEDKIKRVCIQALNYQGVFAHLEALAKEIKTQTMVPLSVSCQPLNMENMQRLKDAGVDRLGVALDAATEAVFDRVKGGGVGSIYRWDNQFRLLQEALAVFGRGNVSTHVIVGLGETERETTQVIERFMDMGVLPALFAFTPIRGTALEGKSPPSLESYRRLQLARYLLVKGLVRVAELQFNDKGQIIGFGKSASAAKAAVESGEPFQTSGCKDCNRPFYNEKPSGPIYNYPIKIKLKEIEKIKGQISEALDY